MKQRLLTILALSANLVLTGCADDQARSELANTNLRVSKIEASIDVLGNKVSAQRGLDMQNRLDDMQNQISALRGQIDTMSENQKRYQSTQDQLNQGLEQQIEGLGGAPVSLPKSSGQGAVGNADSASANSSAPVVGSKQPQAEAPENAQLKVALKKLKARDFNGAIKQLKSVAITSKNPSDIANASYYLSVAYAASGQYKVSITSAKKFMSLSPNSPKIPDAMRIIYICQNQLGLHRQAQATANTLVQKYPNSDAANKIAK